MLFSLGGLTYFHLALSSQDNLSRSDLAGRRSAALCSQQIQLFLRASSDPGNLIACLSGSRGDKLIESLRKTPDLLQFDIFDANGQLLLSSGAIHEDGLQLQQALFWVNTHRESYYEIWGHHQGRQEPLVSVPPFYRGQVVHHSYHPLFDDQGKMTGLVHLALVLPKAPLRINLILLGYGTVAVIFLVSSLLAIYLWAEFALNRPLRGLTASLQQLRALGHQPDDLPQPNELSEAARALNHVTLDLVKYQQELQQKTQHLEQLNEELEQKVADKTLQMREFFSLITHDLRIPLAAVAGYAELLRNPKSGSLTEKQARFLHNIENANGSAQDLVFNLLEAMKYEFGQPSAQLEQFDLEELIKEVKMQLAHEGKPIDLCIDPADNYQCWGDRKRLGRVFSNLLGNALHHAGAVEVELVAQEQTVQVRVKDQGPGIPADELPKLFEKFKASNSGLGLGLYIVQRILQDHAQDITVESEVGKGTTFHFRIPRQREVA